MDRVSFTTSESGHQVPEYGTKPEKAGVYLALFHGRLQSNEQMDDWGFNGPLIGPLEWVHTTYSLHIRLMFINHDDEKLYFQKPAHPDANDIIIADDVIPYAGKYYGDWTVFFVGENEIRKPLDTFRNEPRRIGPYRVDVKRQAGGSSSNPNTE